MTPLRGSILHAETHRAGMAEEREGGEIARKVARREEVEARAGRERAAPETDAEHAVEIGVAGDSELILTWVGRGPEQEVELVFFLASRSRSGVALDRRDSATKVGSPRARAEAMGG